MAIPLQPPPPAFGILPHFQAQKWGKRHCSLSIFEKYGEGWGGVAYHRSSSLTGHPVSCSKSTGFGDMAPVLFGEGWCEVAKHITPNRYPPLRLASICQNINTLQYLFKEMSIWNTSKVDYGDDPSRAQRNPISSFVKSGTES